MGRKSKARRARKKAQDEKKRMEIFVNPKGDKLDINSKTEAGKIALEDAEQGDTSFYHEVAWYDPQTGETYVWF
jgi:hypothetical protein